MFGGVSKAGWATILASGFVLAGGVSANAADLGGDCCADLEERVAELEATTARKGNRKVKLTVYGQVNEAVMFWDDGFEQNAYVVTNDASRTRIGFKGGAKINEDWSANFKIEIGIRTASSKRVNQDDADAIEDSGFDIRHVWWNLSARPTARSRSATRRWPRMKSPKSTSPAPTRSASTLTWKTAALACSYGPTPAA
jgi:hypothetical protein